MNSLSVVIPTKEEAGCLAAVVKELRDVAGPLLREIIVVDAGSLDGTAKIAADLGCKVIQQSAPGYGSAVGEGLRLAQGEFVTFFDADGSYDPNFLLQAIDGMRSQGLDAVFCTRYHPAAGSDDDTWIRYLGNQIFTAILRAFFGVKLTDALHLYVVARREVAQGLVVRGRGFEWCVEFPIRLHQGKFSYTELPMQERRRLAGESKVNALTDGFRILGHMIRWKLRG